LGFAFPGYTRDVARRNDYQLGRVCIIEWEFTYFLQIFLCIYCTELSISYNLHEIPYLYLFEKRRSLPGLPNARSQFYSFFNYPPLLLSLTSLSSTVSPRFSMSFAFAIPANCFTLSCSTGGSNCPCRLKVSLCQLICPPSASRCC
jgi:hypothetical protein